MSRRSLLTIARQELTRATHAAAGRSERVLLGGHEGGSRMSVLALRSDIASSAVPLDLPWTVQVLAGRVRVRHGGATSRGYPGDLLVGSAGGWLTADDDCAVLLTLGPYTTSPAELVRTGAVSEQRHRVVVIGGGFGGLFATRALRAAPAEVTLVDRTGYHLFQPLLYQVATGILSQGEIARPLREILRRQPNARFLLGQVEHIDLRARTVTSTALGHTTVTAYDSLIVAAGATHSYFGNEGFAEHAPGLKSLDDALEIRARIFEAFELAENAVEPRGAMPAPDLRRGRWRTHRDRSRRPDRRAGHPQPSTQLPRRRPRRRARCHPRSRACDVADVRTRASPRARAAIWNGSAWRCTPTPGSSTLTSTGSAISSTVSRTRSKPPPRCGQLA